MALLLPHNYLINKNVLHVREIGFRGANYSCFRGIGLMTDTIVHLPHSTSIIIKAKA